MLVLVANVSAFGLQRLLGAFPAGHGGDGAAGTSYRTATLLIKLLTWLSGRWWRNTEESMPVDIPFSALGDDGVCLQELISAWRNRSYGQRFVGGQAALVLQFGRQYAEEGAWHSGPTGSALWWVAAWNKHYKGMGAFLVPEHWIVVDDGKPPVPQHELTAWQKSKFGWFRKSLVMCQGSGNNRNLKNLQWPRRSDQSRWSLGCWISRILVWMWTNGFFINQSGLCFWSKLICIKKHLLASTSSSTLVTRDRKPLPLKRVAWSSQRPIHLFRWLQVRKQLCMGRSLTGPLLVHQCESRVASKLGSYAGCMLRYFYNWKWKGLRKRCPRLRNTRPLENPVWQRQQCQLPIHDVQLLSRVVKAPAIHLHGLIRPKKMCCSRWSNAGGGKALAAILGHEGLLWTVGLWSWDRQLHATQFGGALPERWKR